MSWVRVTSFGLLLRFLRFSSSLFQVVLFALNQIAIIARLEDLFVLAVETSLVSRFPAPYLLAGSWKPHLASLWNHKFLSGLRSDPPGPSLE